MPYINEEARRQAADDALACRGPADVGTLTYEIQQTILEYLLRHGLRYQQIAEIKGALSEAARDFEQRVVEPYEAKKIRENGDVWPSSLLSRPERPA